MWIKAAILGGSGIIFPNLGLWTVGGLGITITFHSFREWIDNFSRKPVIVAQEEIDNGIDRLPDDILCDIVSRLRSIEASRTGILSRRWRNIWTMNPRLVLCCRLTLDTSKMHDNHNHVYFGERKRYLKAVNQCLKLYSDRKLKLFSLHCCFLNDHTGDLVRWMQNLSRLDVQKLILGHSCETCNVDSEDRLFTFSFKLIDGLSRLRHLGLMSCDVETSFVSPCNSLMILHLWRIPLRNDKLSDIFASCPNLRTVCIEDCELPLNLRISGPHSKLEDLTFCLCYNVQYLEILDFNVTTITINILNKVEVMLSSVPKLVRLHLRTYGTNFCFGDVERDLPQLKYLLIQTPYQMLRLPPTFKVFRNIKLLCLLTRGCLCSEAREEADLWNFASVLSACPLLDEFYLAIGGPVCKRERMAEEWPVFRHKHLVHMELSGFSNTQNELEFAKFMITSAQVLKSLVLRLSSRRYYTKGFYFSDVEDSKRIDTTVAEAIGANLQSHALSVGAEVNLTVKLF